MDMSESKDTTVTLVREPEQVSAPGKSPSGAVPVGTPVVEATARPADPVIVSMVEPRIVLVGLPPAAVGESVDGDNPDGHPLLRPERRVQIGWDPGTGSYRLGLAF